MFPLKPRSKEPNTTNGLKDADNDVVGIGRWWERHPNDNVGAAMGQISGGVFAIDLDIKPDEGVDGYQVMREWEREHGEFPETLTAITGSGGMHYFFRAHGPVKCSVNRTTGVDVRGDGGYVVAPPSVHPNGRTYTWENGPDEYAIAWADENVMAFVDSMRPRGSGERFELPDRIGKGQRNDTLFKYASSLQSKGYPDDEIFDLVSLKNVKLCDVPLDDDEIRKIVESVTNYDKGEKRKPKPAEDVEVVPSGVCELLDRNAKGMPLQSSFNYVQVLDNDEALAGRWWYDVNAWSKMVTLPLPWDGGSGVRSVSDADYSALDVYIGHKYQLTKKTALIDAVAAVCESNRHNPVTETIDSFQWDGVERIPHMLRDLFGTDDTEYNAEVSKLIMHSLVRRAYQPGCKMDYMFVVCGPQGIGKSSAVRALSICTDWFCESLNSFDGNAPVEMIRGALVVEVPELSAFKRTKDIETIKGFITKRIDTIRPAYARETEQRKRSCVLFGTTNVGGFLYDQTGNRRFLMVECGRRKPAYDVINPNDELDTYIRQLYAEAKAWLDDDANSPWRLVLPDTVAEAADEHRIEHIVDDPRIGIVEKYLTDVLFNASRADKRVCIREILVEAFDVSESDWGGPLANDVSEIMRNMDGWRACGREYTKKYGRQRCYKPEGWYYGTGWDNGTGKN